MEHRVLYRDNQELPSDDLNNAEEWTQEALDHVVVDTITTFSRYSGFVISKASATVLSISPGRLYSPTGAVYAREEVVSLDIFNDRPVTTQRYFAIVAWGQTVQEDIQPRDFLVDADTGLAEPQSVAMTETRYCNVNYVRGIESTSAQFPAIDANVTLLGYVLTDPTGILTIIQSSSTQVDNLAIVAARVSMLEAWRGIVDGALATLRTDLANLAKSLLLYTPLSDFQKLVDLVNELWAYAHRPATFIFYGTDRFLDTSQSQTAANIDGAYNARVEEGLRFPGGGTGWVGPLALLNASEPVVQTWDDFTLPRPSGSRVRYDCSFPNLTWTPVRILTFGYWTFTCRHLTPARWRFRCGPPYLPNPPGSVWLYTGDKDPIIINLMFDGPWHAENWAVTNQANTSQHDEDNIYWPRIGQDRWRYYWRDWTTHNYWGKNFTDFSHSGNHCAQTLYNAQDGWLTGLTLFTHTNLSQPITLVISGCLADGTPDHGNQTLRRVVLGADDVTACYAAPILAGDIVSSAGFTTSITPTALQPGTHISTGELVISSTQMGIGITGAPYYSNLLQQIYNIPVYVYPLRINFKPVFLAAGQRIAIHTHSTFDHQLSFVDDDDAPFQVHQGSFWYFDGTLFKIWTSSRRTLRFMAHYATWGRWGDQQSPGGQLNYLINLQPLQLATGIGAVDVLADHIIPAATDLHYEVQVGAVWRAFTQDATFLDGTAPLLQFRVSITGTTDLMPGFSLVNSEVTLARAASNNFYHISTDVLLGSPTTAVKVTLKMHNFVSAHHTCTVALHYGATRNTTGVVADVLNDDGSITRTVAFTTASQSDYVIEITGITDGTGTPFFISERDTYAT